MQWNYKISKFQIGKNLHSKVYILREKISGKEFIVKIYEDSKIINYKNESAILDILNFMNLSEENTFFIMYKNIHYNQDMFQIPKEVKGTNLEFLFYDYLPKLSLLDYINYFKNDKNEIYAKYLCYKLLKAIDIMHSNNISHNKIDTSNIMFDDNFNPKIIHFSEANIIYNNKSEINKDIFELCQILAKILSLGKYNSINYDKKNKVYLINYKNQGKKPFIEESKFWMMIKTLFDINVPKSFINFFHIIFKAKKSKELININEIIKTQWLNEINNEIKNYEEIFKIDFEELYKTIIEDINKKNIINIDIKNILEENNEEISPFHELYNYFNGNNLNEKANINTKYFNNININKSVNNNPFNKRERNNYEEIYIKEEEEEKEEDEKINLKRNRTEEGFSLNFKYEKEKNSQKKDKIEYNKVLSKRKFIEKPPKLGISKTKTIGRNELINTLEIENQFKQILKLMELKHKENINKLKLEFSKNMEQNNMNNYILRGPKKGVINKLNKINNKEEENFFNPRKDDFNYMKIKIKNNENDDINKALNNFIKKLKDKIKQKYKQIDIKISFKEEKDKSFNIYYQIEPMNINFDDIEFLDDEFENKIKNLQQFEINVELIEGNKNMFLNNKINEYYLIFNGISVDKEDFYEHLTILKDIVKNLYII